MFEEATSLSISEGLTIPISELEFRFVRSSGPGGQHVNKTSTQVELRFDLLNSPSISDADRRWLLSRLGRKVDSSGILQVTSQEYRSQLRNRTSTIEKLRDMLKEAMRRPKKRKPTKPTKGAKERRLESKKKHSTVKSLRSGGRFSDD